MASVEAQTASKAAGLSWTTLAIIQPGSSRVVAPLVPYGTRGVEEKRLFVETLKWLRMWEMEDTRRTW